MTIDVLTEVQIDAPADRVAAYAADPTNAPEWYVNIKAVEWKTSPPIAVGSRMAFVAKFLGRRLAYTYEVVELVPGRRLVMRTAEGPLERRRPNEDDASEPRRAVRLFQDRCATHGVGDAPGQPKGPLAAQGALGEALIAERSSPANVVYLGGPLPEVRFSAPA